MEDAYTAQISNHLNQIVTQLTAIREALEKLAGHQEQPYVQTKRY